MKYILLLAVGFTWWMWPKTISETVVVKSSLRSIASIEASEETQENQKIEKLEDPEMTKWKAQEEIIGMEMEKEKQWMNEIVICDIPSTNLSLCKNQQDYDHQLMEEETRAYLMTQKGNKDFNYEKFLDEVVIEDCEIARKYCKQPKDGRFVGMPEKEIIKLKEPLYSENDEGEEVYIPEGTEVDMGYADGDKMDPGLQIQDPNEYLGATGSQEF